jgi:hypothetical protein
MTTIPTQQASGDNKSPNEFSMTLLLGTMSRIEDGVTRLRDDVVMKFDSLGTKFVPRPEIQQKWEESSRDRQEIRSVLAAQAIRIDSEVDKINTRMESAERERVLDRRWAVGTLLTVVIILVAILSIYVRNK